MKLLVCGNEAFIGSLVGHLDQVAKIKPAADVDDAYTQLSGNKFDMVIIDCREKGIGAVCRRIKDNYSVPVILSVSKSFADWNSISDFAIDGFIPENVSRTELHSRLEAILRRTQKKRRLLAPE